MEFNSLKEQRQAHDAAEARAAAAAASVEAEDQPTQSQPSSSKRSTRTKTSHASESGPTSATTATTADAPFAKAMANPKGADTVENDAHMQPLEDGSIPAPGLGSHEDSTSTESEGLDEQAEQEPMRPHNLLPAQRTPPWF